MNSFGDQKISRIAKIRTGIQTIIVILLTFAIIFGCAGTWDYWQGWVFVIIDAICKLSRMVFIPAELIQERAEPEKKLGTKKWDYIIITLYALFSVIGAIIAALDGGRFHWTDVFPIWINMIAFAFFFFCNLLFFYSMWINRFFSVTVRIQEEKGHKVVDNGPYKYIRHPGYAAAITAQLFYAIGLNSLWALIPSGLAAIVFIIRTYLEDITLQKELPGYTDYVARVKYRLFPGLW